MPMISKNSEMASRLALLLKYCAASGLVFAILLIESFNSNIFANKYIWQFATVSMLSAFIATVLIEVILPAIKCKQTLELTQ